MQVRISRSSGRAVVRERAETKRLVTRRTPVNDRTKQSATDLEPTPESTAYELATSIAKHMAGPARWTAKKRTLDEDGRRYAELTRAGDGAEIGVAVGGYRKEGRVTFRAHWPKYKDGQTFTPRSYPESPAARRATPRLSPASSSGDCFPTSIRPTRRRSTRSARAMRGRPRPGARPSGSPRPLVPNHPGSRATASTPTAPPWSFAVDPRRSTG